MQSGRYILVEEDLQKNILAEIQEIKNLIQSNALSKSESSDLLDTADAMAYMKTTRRSLYKYRKLGLPFKQLANGRLYYWRSRIDEFLGKFKN